MALNLSRNTRVWFTTNVDANTGVLTDAASGFTAANTQELQILDGYSFGQTTNAQTITLSEAGNTPARGQRSFNTALNPADFSISTYIRPYKSAAGTSVTAVESVLWNALFNSVAIDSTGVAAVAATNTVTRASTTAAAFTGLQATFSPLPVVGEMYNLQGTTVPEFDQPFTVTSVAGAGPYTVGGTFLRAPTTAAGLTAVCSATTRVYKGAWATSPTAVGSRSYASTLASNKNQMLKFALIFNVDNVYYALDNCALNQATIDFGLDGIGTIAWSGNSTAVKQLANITATAYVAGASTIGGAAVSAFPIDAKYITNKLSTATLVSKIGGFDGGAGTTYTVPITGGSLTINNNINYVTPSNLGVVNKPIGYFTGSRSITGSLNAYLRTGTAGDTGTLLTALLAAGSETKYKLQLEVGGLTNNDRIELEMSGVTLQVPTVDVQDVVSTSISFTAQAFDPLYGVSTQSYDIAGTNDLWLKYYAAT